MPGLNMYHMALTQGNPVCSCSHDNFITTALETRNKNTIWVRQSLEEVTSKLDKSS